MARGKINITFLTLRKYKITLAMLIFLYIGTYRNIDMLEIYCRCPDPAVRTQLVMMLLLLVPDVDARGNTVTHGFILVPVVGPYVQQRGVREHCTILHRGCL